MRLKKVFISDYKNLKDFELKFEGNCPADETPMPMNRQITEKY